MDADSFNDLALRVISREATAEEQHALETELSANPAYREEFEQLRITHDILRMIAPMTEAARATEPGLPAYRLNELRTAVRQHFGPAPSRKRALSPLAFWIRRLLATGAVAVFATIMIVVICSDRAVEVGLYRSDLVRGEENGLTPDAVLSAHVVAFDQDASFDQWQKTLAWYQHAKVWLDNEHNLLHIVQRDAQGHLIERTQPLSQSDREQREQVRKAVESLK